MPGALIMVVLLVVVMPIMFFISGGVIAAILGWALKTDVDEEFEGTEYLELTR